jgi:hypothetical protein
MTLAGSRGQLPNVSLKNLNIAKRRPIANRGLVDDRLPALVGAIVSSR